MNDREKKPLTEGIIKKGGINEKPLVPKQEIKPPAQKPPKK